MNGGHIAGKRKPTMKMRSTAYPENLSCCEKGYEIMGDIMTDHATRAVKILASLYFYAPDYWTGGTDDESLREKARCQQGDIDEVADALTRAAEEAVQAKEKEKKFPIIPSIKNDIAPHPMRVPWSIAELAYSKYSGRYGQQQSLQRLAERGGFHASEMDEFVPDWRERVAQIQAAQPVWRKEKPPTKGMWLYRNGGKTSLAMIVAYPGYEDQTSLVAHLIHEDGTMSYGTMVILCQDGEWAKIAMPREA